MSKYGKVLAAKQSGPDVLQVKEHDLRLPSGREIRIKVLAASVAFPDGEGRFGRTPFPSKILIGPG